MKMFKFLVALRALVVLVMAFSAFSVFSDPISQAEVDEQKRQHTVDRKDRLERERRQAEQEERDREAKLKTETARARREAIKDKEEKCQKAAEAVEEEIKDKKSEANDYEDKFHEKGQDITELEQKLSEKQVELREKINDLKKDSNENLQELKDDMGEAMKGLEDQVAQLTEKINELNTQLEKIEETRLTAYYARRKQQNEFYSKCFGQALTQAEANRKAFYARKQQRRVRRKSMGQLITGGTQQTKNEFSGKFNSYLHLCLNNEAALLEKQNMKDEYQLHLQKMARQEERAKKQIEGIKVQIQKLQTSDKAEVLNRFKQKMEAQLNNFNQSYDMLSKNYQALSQQTLQEIQKIKKLQAGYLMKRSQAVPQKSRNTLISEQCSQMDTFNLFPNEDSSSGLFNSSNRPDSNYTGSGSTR